MRVSIQRVRRLRITRLPLTPFPQDDTMQSFAPASWGPDHVARKRDRGIFRREDAAHLTLRTSRRRPDSLEKCRFASPIIPHDKKTKLFPHTEMER
jgi:hypothetical protein